MRQLQFRFCAIGAAVADGSTVIGEAMGCNELTIEYLLSFPEYKNHWYEVRGGAIGDDWVATTDIILEEQGGIMFRAEGKAK